MKALFVEKMLEVTIAVLWLFVPSCLSQTAHFKVIEESLTGTIIGNIAHLHSSLNQVTYYISSPFMKLSSRGDLVISSRIDLEAICSQYEMCCGEIECIVKTNVIAKDRNSDRSESVTILLTITDKNDNWPRFAHPKQLIEVSENEPIGTYLFLDQAQDADMNPLNKVTQYILKEPTNTFQLDESRFPSIGLIVKKNIDYEDKHSYEAQLEACDSAKQCTTQKIQVEISDKNDNFPIFVKEIYEKEVLENFPIGQEILKVKAIDKDSGRFNQVLYGFQDFDSNLQNTFIITENTGSIKLKKKLSAKIQQKYQFKVYAVDKMAISSHKALANVILNVKDLNDNSPVITQLPSDSRLEIFENELQKQLLTLQVTDKDIGENSNVTCHLLHQSTIDFQLRGVRPDLYELYTMRPFNYEVEKQVKAVVECYDHGIPRNTIQKPLTLHVKDVNEYPPQFDREFYRIKVPENRSPAYFVFKVNATDEDSGALLRYNFLGDDDQYFTIDPESGVISTGPKTLDREKMGKVELLVRVSDSAENPKTGQCTIIIEILDENDNSPRFIMNSSNLFFITENKPIDSKVTGQITATDDDIDAINSKVSFQLRRIFDHRKEPITETPFRILENGEIYNLRRLDREVNSNYTLEVKAHDTGHPPKSTTKNFTIIINDVNDNYPNWVNPKPANGDSPTLNISANTQPGEIVMVLKAVDLDENENGRIVYSIMNNLREFFVLNSSTGELTVARMLPVRSIQLFLRASDSSHPPLFTETSMIVFINGDEVTTLNMSIIMVLIGVTGLVSIFLIVAIICVRRRPRYDQANMAGSDPVFETPKNGSLYYTGAWMQNTDEITCHPRIADTNGMLYYPNDIDSSLQMHTFVSKTSISNPLINYQNMDNTCYATMGNPTALSIQSCGTSGNSQTNLLRTPNSNCYDTHGSIGRFNDMDDDSADSGKGGSEDDSALHQLPLLGTYSTFDNNGKNRLYTTMPYGGRGLTNGRLGHRARGNTPSTINQCPCYMLPEDSVVQAGQPSLLAHQNCYHPNLPSNSARDTSPLGDAYHSSLSHNPSSNYSSQMDQSRAGDRSYIIPNLESTEIQ